MSASTPSAPSRNNFSQNLGRLRAAQKPARGTAAYSRLVNRPLGRLVAAALHTRSLTPDAATAVSASLTALGLFILASVRPSWGMGVVVAFLLAAGYVMDSVDGQLARLRGGGSVRGEWLDHTVDCFKTSSLHLAVLVCWYRFPPASETEVLLIPILFSVTQSVTYFGLILMPYLRRDHAARTPTAGPADMPPTEHPLRKWLILPTDYGFLCWTFVLLATPTVHLVVYSVLALLSAAMLGLAMRKWWRELAPASDPPRPQQEG